MKLFLTALVVLQATLGAFAAPVATPDAHEITINVRSDPASAGNNAVSLLMCGSQNDTAHKSTKRNVIINDENASSFAPRSPLCWEGAKTRCSHDQE